MPEIELSAGTIEYEDTGGDGAPVVVLLHGLADGRARLAPRRRRSCAPTHRCIVPTLPLGAHRPDAPPTPTSRCAARRGSSPSSSTRSTCAT